MGVLKLDNQALFDIIDTTRAVVSQLDLEKSLEIVLRKALKLTGTKAGSIALYDSSTNTMRIRAHKGLPRGFVADREWPVRSRGLTEKIIKSRKVTVINNVTNTSFFTGVTSLNKKIKSLICAPLIHADSVVGILYVDDFTPRRFTQAELKALEIVSSFASIAIFNARTHNHIKKQAITDSLTGLFNRRCFEDILTRELQRAKRHGRDLSLALVDVNDFKKYNDAYGHQAGDEALAALGEAVRWAVRSTDIAARYGGDEIVIILPETNLAKAYNLFAERIKQDIESGFARLTQKRHPLTITIGIAAFPKDGRNARELVLAADKALLSAKKRKNETTIRCAGRVRTTLVTPSRPHTAPDAD